MDLVGDTSWQSNSVEPANGEKSVVIVKIIDSCCAEGFFAFVLTFDFLLVAGPMRGVFTKRTKFIVFDTMD